MKIHFDTGDRQAQGVLARCGLRIVDRKFTTTARAAVTCDRCARFLHLDQGPAVTKPTRRKRPRIL